MSPPSTHWFETMDAAQWLAVTGPVGTAIYAAARFLGPRAVAAWERVQKERLKIADKQASALERLADGQGDVLHELKVMNERMLAVETVIVDKRFSDMGSKLEQLIRQHMGGGELPPGPEPKVSTKGAANSAGAGAAPPNAAPAHRSRAASKP